MDVPESLTSDLTSAVPRLRSFQFEGDKETKQRPVLLLNQTSLRLISCIHVRFFETSLKLL